MFDWLGAFVFRREVISMGQIQDPKTEFARAAKS
jgi:NADH dehydrogenase